MRLIEHLNHDTVRIGAVKRSAPIPVDLKRMYDPDALGAEFLLQLFDPLDALDDKAQMIELLFGETRGILSGYLVERNIVITRRQINVSRIRLPDNVHTQKVLVEGLRKIHVFNLERDVAHPFYSSGSHIKALYHSGIE